MKKAIGLSIILILVMLSGIGCVPLPKSITGGGWVNDGGKVNFGFNAIIIGERNNCGDFSILTNCIDAKGQFQMVKHATKPPTIIHGEFESVWAKGLVNPAIKGKGTCKIKGDDTVWDLVIKVKDQPVNGDWIEAKCGPEEVKGILQGGNIVIHYPDEL
jgi:hypothetical protein